MNMSEFDALTPKPSFNDTLASLRPTDFALPDLPKIPTDQMLPLDPSEIVSDQVSSMVGASGTGGGGDGGGGDGGLGGGFSFLGIESNARRILILYDVSNTSIRKAREAGVPFTMIRDETKELVNKLSISSRFGLMMFARNYVFFNKELVPASDENKDAAGVWMDKYFTEDSPMSQSVPDMVRGSPGFLVLLEAAFSKDPDAIFIVSDGGFYQGSGGTNEKIEYRDIDKLIDRLQKARDKPVAVHFIAANMDRDDESGMKRIIRGSGGGGRFKELGK